MYLNLLDHIDKFVKLDNDETDTLLTYLDHHYPDLEGDEARRGVWLHEVPLSQTHKLRARVNNGKPPSLEVFSEFDIPTVASLLKLYLLELPGTSPYALDPANC